MSGLGAPKQYDWHGLYTEFVQQNQDKEVYLKDFCEVEDLNYQYTSKQFSKIEREIENHRLAKARRRLARLAPEAAEKLGELMGNEDAKIAQSSAISILDRAGVAPQVATTRITTINANNAQIVIPPLFAEIYKGDAERMLGGPVDIGADKEPGSGDAKPRYGLAKRLKQARRSGVGLPTPGPDKSDVERVDVKPEQISKATYSEGQGEPD